MLFRSKLATEIVTMIKQLQPPGRFLSIAKSQSSKAETEGDITSHGPESSWVEMDLEKAIVKACQVMRDIDRPDRKYRVDRKLARLNRLHTLNLVLPTCDGVSGSNDNIQKINDSDKQQEFVVSDDDDKLQTRQQEQLEEQLIDVVDSIAINIAREST